MRYTASSLIALAVVLAVGLTWGDDPPTLEELAAAIERARTGPDGERVVDGHISRKLAVSAEALRAQRTRTELSWGEVLIANLLSQATELTDEQVDVGRKGGKGCADLDDHPK